MSSVLKATTENNTTSVTTQFKKLTTGNVLIVSGIVQSNCHIVEFLNQMFNLSALLLDDALKPAMPLTNSEHSNYCTLMQFVSGLFLCCLIN